MVYTPPGRRSRVVYVPWKVVIAMVYTSPGRRSRVVYVPWKVVIAMVYTYIPWLSVTFASDSPPGA